MFEPLLDVVDHFLEWLGGLDPSVLVLGVMLFTALETTAFIGLVVPGDAAVLLAGSTVDSPTRFVMVLLAGAGGTYLGELGGYTIGRLVGPKLRYSRFGRRIGEERWARAEAYLSGKGASVLIPVRFVSVVHAVAPIVAGTVKMPLRLFAFWAGMGALLWSTTYTAIGTAAGAAYREYRELSLLTTVAVIAAATIVILVRRIIRRRRRARQDLVATKATSGHESS
jgi:membrane-associated protein